MIGRLRGILATKTPPFLLVEVGGIGYELQAPMSTIYHLPEVGLPVTLFTHLYVREDVQVLYGFYEEKEKTLFKELIKVSGVGPKMALAILSGMDVPYFIHCVEQRDLLPLVRLPGVGKKTAERLIIEMAGKLELLGVEDKILSQNIVNSPLNNSGMKAIEKEATGALIALGYKPQEATSAIARVMVEGLSSEELIRRALQGLAKL